MPDWLDPKAVLLPRLMKDAGYVTAHYGKWHLSDPGKKTKAPWPTHAIRDGDYVLTQDETMARTELYNVIEDRSQTQNLADANPKLVATLRAKLDTWRKTIPAFVQSPSPAETRTTVARAKPESAAASQDRAAIFKRWDTNHDNSLSLEEYTAAIRTKETAPARFKAFDKDGDGKLTVDEFVDGR